MNTPLPPPPPASPARDPTTPGNKPAPTALNSAVTTTVIGAPLAIVTVWALETWGTVHGKPLVLDSTTATAIGSVGAALIGYVTQVLQGLFTLVTDRLSETPPPPPAPKP
jgi:hypothetical protein